MTGSGNLGTLTSAVTGGDGGAGGNAVTGNGGDGGRGGVGLYFDNLTGATATISASVTGGDGGRGGSGVWGAAGPGAGGEGIYGQNLSITLASSGSISGGVSGGGVQANAILFASGTNTLDIQGGTITGNVVADGTSDTLRLSGSAGGGFDVSQIGSKYLGFEHFGSAGAATWTLAGTNAATQSWDVSSGALVINGSMANTAFTVASGATLAGSGTIGAVTVQAGGVIGPGEINPSTFGEVFATLHTGDFLLQGTLEIQNAYIASTMYYDSVSVIGTVTLSGTLNLSNGSSTATALGDSITIIDNDGTDAVSGIFTGLAEGASIIAGNTVYKISYHGGDGNDVVLTSAAAIRGGGGAGSAPDQGGLNNPTGAGGAGSDGFWSGGGGGAGAVTGGIGGKGPGDGQRGGTGGVHGYVGATLAGGTGTDGSAGADGVAIGDSGGAGGGGGGAGGYGVVVTGTGNLGSLISDVTGGDGGRGGNSPSWIPGSGGRGGIGLYFDNTAAATATVSAAVTGGNGGSAGSGVLSGDTGSGGEGIYGQNLSITLASGGSITGGMSGDGVTRANAILFTSGTNTLDIQGGTITGNVVANGSDDTLRLSGSTGGSFDVSQIGSKFLDFEHFGSAGTASWTLTGTNTTTQSWGVSSGTLIVDGSMANTDFTVDHGATLGGSGTTGAVHVHSGASIGAGDGPGILHIGNFSLSGTLDIEMGGTGAGTQYDQISVTGTVTLSGGFSLSFLNAFSPALGDSFTIIDNDGTDAVLGTFAHIAEGEYVTIGGQAFQITYQGGDGNDVVLTSVTLAPTETVNDEMTVAEGGAVTITAADLAFSDRDNAAAELVYKITSAVTNGTLYRNGVALGLNDTFTQADIDNDLITYTHDGGETIAASFGFSVSDGDGHSVASQTFSFAVTPVNDAPTLVATGATPTYTEGDAGVALFSGASVDTVEAGQTIQQLTLTVSGIADGSDEQLVIDGTVISLVDGAASTTTGSASVGYSVSVTNGVATITLTDSGLTAAQTKALLEGIRYQNASDDPDAADRVVTLTSIKDSGGTADHGIDTTSVSISSTVHVVAVDTTPPDAPTVGLTSDTGTSGTDRITRNGALTIGNVEQGATVSYIVDGEPASSSYDPDALADGEHTVQVIVTDASNNASTPSSITFTLDRSAAPPVVSLADDTGTSGTDGITSNGHLSVIAEDGAMLSYRVDDFTLSGSYDADALADGEHTVRVYQTDKAGNSSVAGSITFTLDRSAAAPTVTLAEDTGASGADRITSNAALSIAGVEQGATLSYIVDGGQPSDTYDPDTLADGEHTVQVIQKDKVGNISSAGSITFTLDRTAPTVAGLSVTGPGVSNGTGRLVAGQMATFEVLLSEAVTIADASGLTLSLSNGGLATFDQTASTASTLVFTYTVAPGQRSSDLAVTQVNLEGAVLKDEAGHLADLSGAVGNLAGTLVVDGGSGTDGDDVYEGTDGDDRFNGRGGNDTISGGKGDDRLFGGGGNDTVMGGDGDDVLGGRSGDDVLDGGSGNDTIGGRGGNDRLFGGSGRDLLWGNAGDDYLDGGSGNDRLWGGGGNDTLIGGSGNDRLWGGSGDDILIGGKGADRLQGGAGDDMFVFTSLSDSTVKGGGRDTIRYFSDGDRIDLSAIDANSKAGGDQAFVFIGSDGFSGRAGELRYARQGSDTFIYADVDGDRHADFALRLEHAGMLEKSDFLL